MKWLSVLVAPSHLDDAVDALGAIGITRLTVTEVQAYGEQVHHEWLDENDEGAGPAFTPRIRIEAALPDGRLPDVMDALRPSAGPGGIGAGELLVLDLERAMRIRTGETGEIAL